MVGDGYVWGVVVAAEGSSITESLLRLQPSYRLRRGSPGMPQLVWRPDPAKLFADDSALGRFWEPGMIRCGRWRKTI